MNEPEPNKVMKDDANTSACGAGASTNLLREPPDFSFVLGGPLFQLLRRTSLADDDLKLLHRRIIVISVFCWLPLLVLSALGGQLLGGGVRVPFLMDLEAHIKFLVAMPLLIGAELVVHRRMRHVVRQFLQRKLIPVAAMPHFEAAVASAFRLRNSVLAEALLLAFVYSVGILVVWRHYTALDAATWYALPSAAGPKLSLAGMWYGYVSLPVFQFLLFRWYYRLAIWARFLWQVSRIKLNLAPIHPDHTGGLGFITGTVHAFGLLAAAHGALLAGQIANRIFYLGASLPAFKVEIAVLVAFMLVLVIAPLLVFSFQLDETKRLGKREYDTFAMRYVREFDAKWLRGDASTGEPLLGKVDTQALAALNASLEVVRQMHVVPVSKAAVVELAATTLAPIVPLALTMMPAADLLKKLFGLMF